MKKILVILIVCCLCICGCKKSKITMCGSNENSIEIQHNDNIVNKIKIKEVVEFDTLSEAIEAEENLSNQIANQNMNQYLKFVRKDKTITLEGNFTLEEYSSYMNISVNSYSQLIKYIEENTIYSKCQEM